MSDTPTNREELLALIAQEKQEALEWRRAINRRSDAKRDKSERSAYFKTWYRTGDNKKKLRKLQREYQRKRKEEIVKMMGDKCFDCGLSFHPAVYDLHHLDPANKEGSKAMSQISMERLKKELEDCVLLCANCHRIRHFKEEDNA